jgi:DNA mismatch repair ATPase MutS
LNSERDRVSNKEKAKKKENYISKENASNLKRTFENKRRASMHNYASNEENIDGIEKHQMKSYQSKVKRDRNESTARIAF